MFHKTNFLKYRKKYSNTNSKKGQVFTLDFIIGFMLFLMVIVLSVKILLSMPTSETDISLHRESVFLSDSVLSEGYPYNWNDSTVIIPGIAKDNRIDLQKLEYMDNLSYGRSKTLYHISNDYVFFFSNSTGIINVSKCSYGAPISYTQFDQGLGTDVGRKADLYQLD